MTKEEIAELKQGSLFHYEHMLGHFFVMLVIINGGYQIKVLKYNSMTKNFIYDTYTSNRLNDTRYRGGVPPWDEYEEQTFLKNIRELRGDLSNLESMIEELKKENEDESN